MPWAVAGTPAAASSVVNGLQSALNQQANQQAIAKREADAASVKGQQQSFADQLELARMGGVPSQTYGGDVPPDPTRPTLRMPEANPAAQGSGNTVTDPNGNRTYIPTEAEKDAKSGKTFVPTGQLGDALKTAGWDGKTPVTPTQSHELMQALHEAQPPDGEPYDVDTSGKFLDARGNPVPVTIGRKTGQVRMLDLSGGADAQPALPPPGSPARGMGPQAMQGGAPASQTEDEAAQGAQQPTAGASATGPFTFAPPAAKTGTRTVLQGVVGPNGGPILLDHDTGTLTEAPPIPGSKQTMTASQTEADKDRHTAQANRADDKADAASLRAETKAQGDRDRGQKQIDIFQTREQEQHHLAAAYGKVLSQPNTVSKESNQLPVPVVDPVTGRTTLMTEERRAYFKSQYDNAKAMADTWHQQGVKLIQRFGGDTGETPKQPAQAPAQQAAAPVAQAAAAGPGRGAAKSATTAPTRLSTGHQIGDPVTLKNGKTIKITKINPDDTFEGN